VASVLDDDADVRRGIERRLRAVAGTVGQCAELHGELHGILGFIQVRGDGEDSRALCVRGLGRTS